MYFSELAKFSDPARDDTCSVSVKTRTSSMDTHEWRKNRPTKWFDIQVINIINGSDIIFLYLFLDLELAAEIGKNLLERNKELEVMLKSSHHYLEEQSIKNEVCECSQLFRDTKAVSRLFIITGLRENNATNIFKPWALQPLLACVKRVESPRQLTKQLLWTLVSRAFSKVWIESAHFSVKSPQTSTLLILRHLSLRPWH